MSYKSLDCWTCDACGKVEHLPWSFSSASPIPSGWIKADTLNGYMFDSEYIACSKPCHANIMSKDFICKHFETRVIDSRTDGSLIRVCVGCNQEIL